MPLSGIAEAILRPVFEAVMYVAGYLTGYVVVPVVTLGRVRVVPDIEKQAGVATVGGLKRRADRVLTIDADWGAVCGVVFWAVVGVVAYIWHTRF